MISHFCSSTGDPFVEQEGNRGESLCTRRRESELPAGTDFSQNSQPYIVLKLSRFLPLVTAYTNVMLAFHWLWFTPNQCLFSIGHDLHPRNACFSLAMVYTHAMLVLRWLPLIPTFPVIISLILWMTGCMRL